MARPLTAWKKALRAACRADHVPFAADIDMSREVWGAAVRRQTQTWWKVRGKDASGKLTRATRKALTPYLPPRYRLRYPIVGIEAGHYSGWNASRNLTDGSEGASVRRIARELAAELRRRGVQVVANDANLDLSPSIDWMLAHLPAGALAIELHENAGAPSARGFLCIYSPWSPRSLLAARRISAAVKRSGLLPLSNRGLLSSAVVAGWHGWQDIGWTRAMRAGGRVPVMPEMIYFTNGRDAAIVNDPAKRARLVQAMADGIAPKTGA
jgi:N-acetylmuramoyl-L-alanine amidase